MVCDKQEVLFRMGSSVVLILILLEYGLRQIALRTRAKHGFVLILILLEYGLRLFNSLGNSNNSFVLILILLEYGLRRDLRGLSSSSSRSVLILILLEYGLRPFQWRDLRGLLSSCLNPYSIGIWSATSFLSTL